MDNVLITGEIEFEPHSVKISEFYCHIRGNFSATRILREIKFGTLAKCKTTLLTNLQVLNSDLENLQIIPAMKFTIF